MNTVTRKLVARVVALVVGLPLIATAGVETEVHVYGGVGYDSGTAVEMDDQGNLYIAGRFNDTITFGPTTYTSLGVADAFVAKIRADGSLAWSVTGGGTSFDIVTDLTVDPSGNVTVIGLSSSPAPSFGGAALPTAGDHDVFVASYNPIGIHRWSAVFGGAEDERGLGIDSDSAGNLLICGSFQSTADFGPFALTSQGGSDGFVAALDATGAVFGAQGYGDIDGDCVTSVVFGPLDSYAITGDFIGTIDFGLGPLVSAGVQDIFLAKFQAGTATPRWSRQFGGVDFDGGACVDIGAGGVVYVTGHFSDTVDFGGGGLASAGRSDVFVAAYTPAGFHVWSEAFGGTESDFGLGLDVHADRVAVTGYFLQTMTIGPATLSSRGWYDAFVAEFELSGTFRAASRAGGNEADIGVAVAVSGDRIVSTGYFEGPALFGNDSVGGIDDSDAYFWIVQDVIVSIGDGVIPGSVPSPAFPNPTTGGTGFHLGGIVERGAQFEVFDAGGRAVYRTRISDSAATIRWDGHDDAGRRVVPGVYHMRVSQSGTQETRRVTVVR